MAKAATDSVLSKFKAEEWKAPNNIGRYFYRVTTDASFPSPDAAFYDETNKFLAAFEFKPPTETKRGILTGVGQSIAYLEDNNISFLVAPEYLEDFRLGEYLENLFSHQIYGKLPVGLIIYENNLPQNVRLATNISEEISRARLDFETKPITSSRYWAKHQDLPLPLFHLLLHCYFLKKSNTIQDDAFRYCWEHYMISPTILTDFQPKQVLDCSNHVIRTLADTKDFLLLEKILHKTASMDELERIEIIKHEIDTTFVGDNKYQAYRKNFVTFLKHIKVIDSNGDLTDSGFKLYHIGLVNGARSKIFQDYFTKEILTTGHHLDLILDLDTLLRSYDSNLNMCIGLLESEYEQKGLIKRNPKRQNSNKNTVGFLKYECILWRSLKLLKQISRNKYSIDWKLITAICSLPDL